MKKSKKEALEKLGYRVLDTKRFLNLSDHEMELIDLKIKLIKKLRDVRKKTGVTQQQLATLLKSSQSRVAMIENGSSDISLDLICKALFALGLSAQQLGRAMSTVRSAK